MKITKEKTWTMIELLFAGYFIISCCIAPDKPHALGESVRIKNNKQIAQNERIGFKKTFKTIAAAKNFFLNNY